MPPNVVALTAEATAVPSVVCVLVNAAGWLVTMPLPFQLGWPAVIVPIPFLIWVTTSGRDMLERMSLYLSTSICVPLFSVTVGILAELTNCALTLPDPAEVFC